MAPAGRMREAHRNVRNVLAYTVMASTSSRLTEVQLCDLRNATTTSRPVSAKATALEAAETSRRDRPVKMASSIWACTSIPDAGISVAKGVFNRSPISVAPKPTNTGRPSNRTPRLPPWSTVAAERVSNPSRRKGIRTRRGAARLILNESSETGTRYESRNAEAR